MFYPRTDHLLMPGTMMPAIATPLPANGRPSEHRHRLSKMNIVVQADTLIAPRQIERGGTPRPWLNRQAVLSSQSECPRVIAARQQCGSDHRGQLVGAGISTNRTEDEVFLSVKAETAHVLEPELDMSTKRATVQAVDK